ncbi:MAG: hypothetical protein ACR2N7_11870, partial [Acidimicrobiia bacterium]
MSGPTAIVLLIAAAGGVFAARTVVAEADAHRLGLSDRWHTPQCGECGASLNVTMLRCTQQGHHQRTANVWILGVTVVVFAAMAVAVPSPF